MENETVILEENKEAVEIYFLYWQTHISRLEEESRRIHLGMALVDVAQALYGNDTALVLLAKYLEYSLSPAPIVGKME